MSISARNKVLAHQVNSARSGTDSELLSLVRKMSEDQQANNREFESCIVSLTEMLKGTNIKTENHCGGCWLQNNGLFMLFQL